MNSMDIKSNEKRKDLRMLSSIFAILFDNGFYSDLNFSKDTWSCRLNLSVDFNSIFVDEKTLKMNFLIEEFEKPICEVHKINKVVRSRTFKFNGTMDSFEENRRKFRCFVEDMISKYGRVFFGESLND